MANRRVVVTGLGVISALGRKTSDFWAALRQGRGGIRPIQAVDCSQFRFQNGAEVPGYNPADYFDRRQLAQMDHFAQFAVIAAREAVADARVEWNVPLRQRTAVLMGSSTAGQTTLDGQFKAVYAERRRVSPLTVPRVMASAGTSFITVEFGLHGPAYSVASACSSASHAIGQAFWMVRSGQVDMALAGGSDAPFSYGNLRAWEALRVISPDTCRPFSLNRRGMILGEGGAVLVLEPLEAARARGAAIHAELVGCGMSADAWHLTTPSAEGAAQAIAQALCDAGLRPEQVGHINAHGTGTTVNDPMETLALRLVFGDHTDRLAVSATKSMHGHSLGAAGAMEAIATVLALKEGLLPPTANFCEPDPECALDVIPNQAREAHVEYAVSNSFAFGGLNAVLAFRRGE